MGQHLNDFEESAQKTVKGVSVYMVFFMSNVMMAKPS